MRCIQCNSTQIYHREKTNDFKCIKCGGVSDAKKVADVSKRVQEMSRKV